MKYLLPLLLLGLTMTCYGQNSAEIEAVRIEHIGENDKPLSPIIICRKGYTSTGTYIIFADPETLKSAGDFAGQNDTHILNPTTRELGVFKVCTKLKDKTETCYILPTRQLSIQYLKAFQESVGSDGKYPALSNALDELLQQITF